MWEKICECCGESFSTPTAYEAHVRSKTMTTPNKDREETMTTYALPDANFDYSAIIKERDDLRAKIAILEERERWNIKKGVYVPKDCQALVDKLRAQIAKLTAPPSEGDIRDISILMAAKFIGKKISGELLRAAITKFQEMRS